MGISRHEALYEYYLDELMTVLDAYAEMRGADDPDRVEEVFADEL